MKPVTLKPVTQSRIADISDRLPVLLLERNQWPASYVRSLVKKSPACITSRKGTQLPLELWLEIIEIVEFAPDDYCALLQPVSVRETDGRSLLVCVEITDWDTCGELKCTWAYDHHLYNPYQKDGYEKMEEGEEEPRPWRIPEVTPENEILIELSSIPEEEDQLSGIMAAAGCTQQADTAGRFRTATGSGLAGLTMVEAIFSARFVVARTL